MFTKMLLMHFKIEHPISRERLCAAARRIYGVSDSEIDVREDHDRPRDKTKKLKIIQDVSQRHFGTTIWINITEDPRAAARALAVEGGVEVLWFDEENAEWDDDNVYAPSPGPYYFFLPDGTVREARLNVAKVKTETWGGRRLSIEEEFIFLD